MKKTIIATLALAGVASAWDNEYTDTSFTLVDTLTVSDRLIFDGAASSSIVVTTTGDVTVGEINANSSGNITNVTFNLGGAFTIGNKGQSFMGKGEPFSITLNLGEKGSFVMENNNFSSGKNAALTLNAVLGSGVTERVLVDASATGKFINVGSITLSITSQDGYANGGLVYKYDGKYYGSSDVTNSGGRLTIAENAKEFTFAQDTVYTVVSACKVDDNKPVLNKITLMTIPEPTTATLSLLALAGLAARRRRK